MIQYFLNIKICREKGFCDEGCGEPFPDVATPKPPSRVTIDRKTVDRATVSRSAIRQLFAKEPLLAAVIAGSFENDADGTSFLDLEPSNGGTFVFSGISYAYQLQFMKLSEEAVQFRFVIREAKEASSPRTTFVGEIRERGAAMNYARTRQDAAGNTLDRSHVAWKATP